MDIFINKTLLESLPDKELSQAVDNQIKRNNEDAAKTLDHNANSEEQQQRLLGLCKEQERRSLFRDPSWKTILDVTSPSGGVIEQAWIEKCSEHFLMPGRVDDAIGQRVIECAIDTSDPQSMMMQQKAVHDALPFVVAQVDPWGRWIRRIDLILDYDTQEMVQFFLGFDVNDETKVVIYRENIHHLSYLEIHHKQLWKVVTNYLWWISGQDRDDAQRHSLAFDEFLMVDTRPSYWKR